MNSKLSVALVCGLIIGVISGLATQTSVLGELWRFNGTKATGLALIGGDFELVNHKGLTVSANTYKGQYTLVYFGFTYCPDICPAGLQIITEAMEKLGAKAQLITPLFISLDPGRDTHQKMAEYVSSFHPQLVGLTGSKAQIRTVARAYRVFYTKNKNSQEPGDYTIDHSGYIYLMSPDGSYLRHFPHSVSVDTLAKALNQATPTLTYWQKFQGLFAN